MTRNEFTAAWPGASADARFGNFVVWIQAEITSIDDLIPPFSVVRDPATATVAQLGGAGFSVNPDLFEDAGPDRALDAGDAIVGSLFHLAMNNYLEKLEEKKQYEKDARKAREKRWDKLLKDSKPKGKDPNAIYYEIYVKPIEELEKGSG
ncbi:MAG: hypothetical protein AAFX58_12595 [Pseudomonadota bacterium]